MITGEKTILRGIKKEDANDIYEWVNIEENRKFTGTQYPVSEYEHEKWFSTITTLDNVKLFLVLDKLNGKKLGTIGLKHFDFTNRNVELFINLGISGGYGTDAVATMTEYCFRHLNYHKVYLYVYESNKRAIRCYEKAGFTMEGKLIEHHFNNYSYENVFIMSKIRK